MRDASASADRLISTTIYVGNLPFAVSEAELRGLVLTRMPAEALGSVSVVRNPLGRSKGFGFECLRAQSARGAPPRRGRARSAIVLDLTNTRPPSFVVQYSCLNPD